MILESFNARDAVFTCTPYIIISIIFLTLGYELLFHPLNRYPGPLIARFTNGYAVFYSLKRSFHLVTLKEHIKYGPVFRQGPNKLLFNTTTAYKDIYSNDKVTKPVIYLSNQATPGSYNIWTAIEKTAHRQRRRLVGSVVNDRSMRIFEPTINEQVDIFIKQIALNMERPLDLKDRINYLSMDIIGLLSFGFDLRSQTQEKYRYFSDDMPDANSRLNIYMQVPAIAKYRLFVPLDMLWHKAQEKMYGLIEFMIKSRMAKAQNAKYDLYSVISDALTTEEGEGLRVNDLWMEAIFFIVAGGDTISTAIAATFFYVARHRECYKKLAEEIRSTFSSADDICGSKLTGCRYLRACIDEAMRMSPPIPSTLWRQLAPEHEGKDALVVDGHVIPTGTYVGVNIYALHHNEDYFPDPFVYKPERWLEPNGEEGAPGSRKTMNDAFVPFSNGQRGCAGKPMAYLETNLAIAKALWYFDFQPAPGELGDVGLSDKGEFRLHGVFVSTHDGPWLTFSPRDTLYADFPDLKH